MAIALILFLLLFPIGQLGRALLGSGIYLNFQEVVLGMGFLTSLLVYPKILKYLLNQPLLRSILAFILFSTLSLILNPLHLNASEWITSSLYLIRFVLYMWVYIAAKILIKTQPELKLPMLTSLFFAGVAISLFGLIQYFLYPNLRNLYYLGWDPHEYRLFSTLLDPNFTGIILLLTIYLGDKLYKRNIIVIIGIIVCLVAFMLTYSRSSYIALFLSLPFILYNQVSWKIIASIYFFIIVSIFLLPRPFGEGVKLERTSTLSSRVESYRQSIEIIQKYPIFGVGFNAVRYAKRAMGFLPEVNWQDDHAGSGVDNSFLFSWITSGVGGIVSLVGFFFIVLKVAYRKLTLKNTSSRMIIASTVAIIIHSQFVNSLFFPWVMGWYFLLLGLLD